ncbi:MFS transporter [Rhodosalinus halophilus]|uniref:MFS transporter n=1 Tax=Rhodosalinus halophilus TaxID=2259333 RepID=A0A365U7U4_9RHOB|nr:MFS transporter [Rhodosalinus halophilus]RBI84906.1 MFS transporter [Rhodosalinus halophilus]
MRPAVSPLALVLALYCAGLGAAGQYATFAVPFAALSRAYPEAGAALGWVVSALSLLGVALGLAAGALTARLGFRRSLIIALALGAAISAAQTTLPPLPMMLALRLAEGASHLAIVVAAPTLIAQIAPARWRGAALTLWGTFFGVAFTGVAVAGLPLVAAAGLPALLWAHAAWMAAMAALLAWRLPREQAPACEEAVPGLVAAHLEVYRSPRLAAPAAGWLFYTLTYVALLAVWPLVLSAEAGRALAALAPLAGIAVSMTLGVWLLRWMPAVRVILWGFALGLALAPLLGAGLVPAVALFAALGLVQGASFAAVPELNATARDRALANGALAQMGNAGNLLGTPVMLAALSAGGTAGPVALVMAAYAAAIAAHLGFARLRRRGAA